MQLDSMRVWGFAAVLCATLAAVVNAAVPMGTGFTYQGQLKEQGVPIDGDVDLVFTLFDVETGGVPRGALNLNNISVSQGLFVVELDFGSSVFDGKALWVELAVRYPHDPSETDPFTTLAPRQSLTPTPYALQTRGLFVDDDGEVGIGTKSPGYTLHADSSEDRTIFAVTDHTEGKAIFGLGAASTGYNAGVWGQSSSEDGYGVYGWADAVSGSNYGVYGISWSDAGTGVFGYAFSASGSTFGVHGWSRSDSGTGVYGYASSHIGNTEGVYGRADSDTGIGVYGWAWSTTGTTFGVKGGSRSENGTGVYGFGGSTGPNIGVHGHTSSPDGFAGYFTGGKTYFEGNVGIGTESPAYPLDVQSDAGRTINAINSSANGYAVYGEAVDGTAGRFKLTGSAGSAVIGWASSHTGPTNAARFQTDSQSGYAVKAVATSNNGTNYGVYGESKSPDGYAGYFKGDQSCFPDGKVGIGTDAPEYPLHVNWTGSRLVYVRNNNSFGEAIYGHASRADGTTHAVHGKAESPNAYAGYFEGGKNYFDGHVGFGTDDPDYPIHVQSDAFLAIHGRTSATNGSGVYGSASAASGDTYGGRFISSSEGGCGVKGTGFRSSGVNYGVKGHTASPAGFAGYFTGGRNYFQGKVGIGTDSPACKLDVLGMARVWGANWPSSGQGLELAYSSTLNRGYIQVYNRDSAAWGSLFLGDGNVGIGTESPSAKLELGGANANIKVLEEGGDPFLGIGDNATTVGWLQWDSLENDLTLYTYGHDHYIQIGPTTVGGLTVSSDTNHGNVGIGMGGYAPAAKLMVDSTADVDAFRVRVGGLTKFAVKRNGRTAVGDNLLPSYQLQVFGTGTAGKPGGGSWSNSSDRRLKKNIRDLEGSLDRLLQLRSVRFEYTDPESIHELPGERIGMIAQEVEGVFPDWVSEGGHGYKILTYRGFEALTVDALRELREEKDRQLRENRQEIDRLGHQLAEMQDRLAKLESMWVEDNDGTH